MCFYLFIYLTLTPVHVIDSLSQPVSWLHSCKLKRSIYLFTPETYMRKEKSAYQYLALGQETEMNRGVPLGHHCYKP
jgi:hypothetical protein